VSWPFKRQGATEQAPPMPVGLYWTGRCWKDWEAECAERTAAATFERHAALRAAQVAADVATKGPPSSDRAANL
jgi:hypothetical protein